MSVEKNCICWFLCNIVSRWCYFKIFFPKICNNLQNALSNSIVWCVKNIFLFSWCPFRRIQRTIHSGLFLLFSWCSLKCSQPIVHNACGLVSVAQIKSTALSTVMLFTNSNTVQITHECHWKQAAVISCGHTSFFFSFTVQIKEQANISSSPVK